MANFPASLDNGSSLPTPAAGNNTNSPSHAGLHGAENAAIIATETKLGTGATVPAANQLLVGTGAGTSAWQGLTSAQLAAILSDETGSGAAVFANTPTLITPKVDTINESTPGNGVTVSSVNLKSGAISGATTIVGSGAATLGSVVTNTIGANGANHLALSAGTSKLVKTTLLRQDDTTNTYQVGNSVMLTGWGVITPGVTNTASETVTFGITFLQRPIVVLTPGGDAVSAATYGSGNNTLQGNLAGKATAITTTSFAAYIFAGGNWAAGNTVFYQWMAIGEI